MNTDYNKKALAFFGLLKLPLSFMESLLVTLANLVTLKERFLGFCLFGFFFSSGLQSIYLLKV